MEAWDSKLPTSHQSLMERMVGLSVRNFFANMAVAVERIEEDIDRLEKPLEPPT